MKKKLLIGLIILFITSCGKTNKEKYNELSKPITVAMKAKLVNNENDSIMILRDAKSQVLVLDNYHGCFTSSTLDYHNQGDTVNDLIK